MAAIVKRPGEERTYMLNGESTLDIEHLAVGGHCLIEDISHAALPICHTAGALLRDVFESTIVRCRASYAFVCRKLATLPHP